MLSWLSSVFIEVAARGLRPQAGEETPLPPLARRLIHNRALPVEFKNAYGIQVPGLPQPRTSERAEPHFRVRPRGVEPNPGLAADPLPRRARQHELRSGQRLPDRF